MRTILATACLLLAALVPEGAQAQERIVPEGMRMTYDAFHYAPAVRVGNTLYLSGVIGGSEDPAEQFDQAFRALQTVLGAAGATLADIVEMTTFHVNMSEHVEAFMAVKDRYITDNYPAWTAIGVDQLFSPRALVEVKVIAVLKEGG